MAGVQIVISNTAYGGTTSINLLLLSAGYLASDANPVLGRPQPDGTQALDLPVTVKDTTEAGLATKITALRRLVNEAARQRRIGRRVALTINAEGGTPTTYFVLSGTYDDSAQALDVGRWAGAYEHDVTLHLVCEALGRSAETQPVTSGTLSSVLGLSAVWARYATGALFQGNVAQLQNGYLFAPNKFTTSPTTLPMENGFAMYFGNATSFDRIITGVPISASWVGTGVWEYWAGGGGWTALTPTINSFKTTRDWDTAANFGAIGGWGTLTGWTAATLTAAGITGTGIPSDSLLWIRWRISAFTSVSRSPTHCNGWGSLNGLAEVTAANVPGDTDAVALVHVTNPGATALAGVEAALVVGELADYPPPMEVDFAGADLFIPSGDTTAAVVASTAAAKGERVDITFVASLSDRAQTFTAASTQVATTTVASGDKLDNLGSGSFTIEVAVKFTTVPSGPVPICSRWNTSNQIFWCGIDQGKLKMMVWTAAGRLKTVYGTSTIEAGAWEVLTWEFDSSANRIRVYRASGLEAEAGTKWYLLRSALTTQFPGRPLAGLHAVIRRQRRRDGRGLSRWRDQLPLD
jgi:hypothetical protein